MSTEKCKLIEYDIRGQICPSSLLTTLREINTLREELKRGTTRIRVLTDNRDATVTIPDAANKMGYEVSVKKEQQHYCIEIDKPKA